MPLVGSVLGQAPFEDFARDNNPLLGVLVCAILAILTIRLITRAVTRLVLLGLFFLVATFVVVQRDNITECTQTCECEIAGIDAEIPYCNPDLPRTGD